MDITTESSPAVRRATARDEEGVAALLTASQLPLDGVHESLGCFVVAEENGKIVGVAGIEDCGTTGEYALLRSVAVEPAWRSKGLGRTLVGEAIELAERRGAKATYLLTTTAERYFPSFGFAKTDRASVPAEVKATVEFQGACPASATVMVRGAPSV